MRVVNSNQHVIDYLEVQHDRISARRVKEIKAQRGWK